MSQPKTTDGIKLCDGDEIMIGVKNSPYGLFKCVIFKGVSGGYFYRNENGTEFAWPCFPECYDINKIDTVGTVA